MNLRLGISLILIAGALLGARASLAIGRTGQGKVEDHALGFSLTPPSLFMRTQQSGDTVIVTAPQILIGPLNGGPPPSLLYQPALDEFSDLADLSRQNTKDKFIAAGWQVMGSANECIDAYGLKESGSFRIVALWGPGKGIVIAATVDSEAMNGAIESMDSIRLDDGACTWR